MQVGTSPILSKVGECGDGDFVNLLQLSLKVAVVDGSVCAVSTLPPLCDHVLGLRGHCVVTHQNTRTRVPILEEITSPVRVYSTRL